MFEFLNQWRALPLEYKLSGFLVICVMFIVICGMIIWLCNLISQILNDRHREKMARIAGETQPLVILSASPEDTQRILALVEERVHAAIKTQKRFRPKLIWKRKDDGTVPPSPPFVG